jgi:hypothetical protein
MRRRLPPHGPQGRAYNGKAPYMLAHSHIFTRISTRVNPKNVLTFLQSLLIMRPNLIRCIVALSLGLTISSVSATSDPFYDLNFSGHFLIHPHDPLAPRDEWGMLHRNSRLDPTDFARRGTSRLDYYYRSGRSLLTDPAYVGMLQTVLRNNGYYCGPIDGIDSEDLSVAIARMQRNFRLRVTGTLTIAVRRSLHLP